MRERISLENTLGIVLAGGKGERLYPLTKERAKPAVPIAGSLRIIDFVLNNFIKSGIRKINIYTQTKQESLNQHISDFWYLNRIVGEYTNVVPAQMRTGTDWYKGTADAVSQNIHHINEARPEMVAIFGGDHVYYMNVNEAIQYHKNNSADVTIIAKKVPKSECQIEKDGRLSFGIINTNSENIITGFKEKPYPKDVPQEEFFISMGNYIFNTEILKDSLKDNPADFGKDVLPRLVKEGKKIVVYDFGTNNVPGIVELREKSYWEDVGNIDSYFGANMMLTSIEPKLNLYNKEWAIWNSHHFKNYAPSKTVFTEGMNEDFLNELQKKGSRIGGAFGSLISLGGIISGNAINSIIGANAQIHSYATVIDSVIFDDVDIGRGSKIRRTIIDKNVKIPPNTSIGYNREEDLARGFTVSDGGITVVEKNYVFK